MEGTDSKEIKEYRWKHEVEGTRRKKDDEFRSEISLRNEYNTKYNMCKPSFQGLSGEASQKVFPFDTALAIVLAVEVDLPRILLFLPCIFGIILVFPGRHYECTHHNHNSCAGQSCRRPPRSCQCSRHRCQAARLLRYIETSSA